MRDPTYTVACCVDVDIQLHHRQRPPQPVLLEKCGLCITLHCPLTSGGQNGRASPPPPPTASEDSSPQWAIVLPGKLVQNSRSGWEGVLDDATRRQGSWESGRERARKAVRQSKAPHSDSQQRSMWLHLLNGLMISRPRLCVLGTLRAQPENHRFVWRRAADMPKSPSCYGRGSGTERNGSSPRKKGCVKKEQFSIQFKLCQ